MRTNRKSLFYLLFFLMSAPARAEIYFSEPRVDFRYFNFGTSDLNQLSANNAYSPAPLLNQKNGDYRHATDLAVMFDTNWTTRLISSLGLRIGLPASQTTSGQTPGGVTVTKKTQFLGLRPEYQLAKQWTLDHRDSLHLRLGARFGLGASFLSQSISGDDSGKILSFGWMSEIGLLARLEKQWKKKFTTGFELFGSHIKSSAFSTISHSGDFYRDFLSGDQLQIKAAGGGSKNFGISQFSFGAVLSIAYQFGTGAREDSQSPEPVGPPPGTEEVKPAVLPNFDTTPAPAPSDELKPWEQVDPMPDLEFF